MHRSSAELHGVHEPSVAAPRREESHFFTGFTFNGSTRLGALTGFYGLRVPGLDAEITLAEYLARSACGVPRPGDRVTLECAELVVREIEEGIVRKVGLRLLPPAPRRHRRRWPNGKMCSIGVSASRAIGGLTGTAAELKP